MNDTTLVRFEGGKESYRVPSSIEIIADNAFYDRGELRRLVIPRSVTSIGDYAFKLCFKLKTIDLPPKVSHFGVGVFQQCHNLEAVMLPEGVEVIDSGMFVSCNSLLELGLPGTLSEIVPGALASCINLEAIYASAKVFNLIPDNKKLIAALTYIDQIGLANEMMRDKLISEGDNIFEYIRNNISDAIKRILLKKQEYVLSDLLRYADLTADDCTVILDILMDERREDLSSAVIEARLNASVTKENSIFDANPFA